ncbi:MAG: recombination mediator RecR [Corallococcus sp.]|nr:recombination mediator RecR [Corallococcus sp.]MCM1359365.1 recombination mediator RecR [Corallococcus sp.]MCM1394808.1 recombination mediator RecR [Corallococcus sp.]
MPNYIEPIEKLIRQFQKLPGVGSKTAQRYALRILAMTEEEAFSFAEAVTFAKQNVAVCSVCGNYTDTDPCHICKTRDNSLICVVQEAKDVLAIERIGEYKGVYHVLGGVLNPLKGIGRDDIRLSQLFSRLTGDVKEVILATDTSAEGEATATYIARFVKQCQIKVTRLAQGISIGSELQYADEVTLSRAFINRKEL